MNILYKRLFNLSINHAYYENSRAKGLVLYPTKETLKLLKGGRMLFKYLPKGFTVLYRTLDDEVSAFVDMGQDLRLVFEINIENRFEFLNITHLDESPIRKFSSSNILYFKNNPASASIDPTSPEPLEFELLDFIQSSLFTYEFTVDTSPAQVKFRLYAEDETSLISVGKDVEGVPFNTTLTLNINDNGTYSQQIDLRDKPKGKYVIIIRNNSDTIDLLRKVVYVDDDLAGKKISGIVDITYNAAEGHIYEETEEYSIQLSSVESIWKYLIVNKSKILDFSTDVISINDAGSSVGPYIVNGFDISGSSPHGDIRINDLDTVVILSSAEIPFYEIPKIKLELKSSTLPKPLFTNLPNPSHSGVVKEEAGLLASEIYVFI